MKLDNSAASVCSVGRGGSLGERTMPVKRKEEDRIRRWFERWAKSGMRPHFYSLEKAANDDYFSPFTEMAWKAFLQGWARENE